jgi:hypothetical protein
MQAAREPLDKTQNTYRVSTDARVWRHWYSTLSQMVSSMTLQERSRLRVVPVPGRPVAGEWYTAIPRYSAAHDVGMRILQQLATPQANIERLHDGVGLPTLRSFYERRASKGPLTPDFAATCYEVYQAIENALPRSRIENYSDHASVLGHNLIQLLELPSAQIQSALTKLRDELSFLDHPGHRAD